MLLVLQCKLCVPLARLANPRQYDQKRKLTADRLENLVAFGKRAATNGGDDAG